MHKHMHQRKHNTHAHRTQATPTLNIIPASKGVTTEPIRLVLKLLNWSAVRWIVVRNPKWKSSILGEMKTQKKTNNKIKETEINLGKIIYGANFYLLLICSFSFCFFFCSILKINAKNSSTFSKVVEKKLAIGITEKIKINESRKY